MIFVITIPGVLSVLLETQHHALVQIPRATTLTFELMSATTIVLVLALTLLFVTQ